MENQKKSTNDMRKKMNDIVKVINDIQNDITIIKNMQQEYHLQKEQLQHRTESTERDVNNKRTQLFETYDNLMNSLNMTYSFNDSNTLAIIHDIFAKIDKQCLQQLKETQNELIDLDSTIIREHSLIFTRTEDYISKKSQSLFEQLNIFTQHVEILFGLLTDFDYEQKEIMSSFEHTETYIQEIGLENKKMLENIYNLNNEITRKTEYIDSMKLIMNENNGVIRELGCKNERLRSELFIKTDELEIKKNLIDNSTKTENLIKEKEKEIRIMKTIINDKEVMYTKVKSDCNEYYKENKVKEEKLKEQDALIKKKKCKENELLRECNNYKRRLYVIKQNDIKQIGCHYNNDVAGVVMIIRIIFLLCITPSFLFYKIIKKII